MCVCVRFFCNLKSRGEFPPAGSFSRRLPGIGQRKARSFATVPLVGNRNHFLCFSQAVSMSWAGVNLNWCLCWLQASQAAAFHTMLQGSPFLVFFTSFFRSLWFLVSLHFFRSFSNSISFLLFPILQDLRYRDANMWLIHVLTIRVHLLFLSWGIVGPALLVHTFFCHFQSVTLRNFLCLVILLRSSQALAYDVC